MNWPTFVIATIIAVVFLAIIIRGIRNRKNGKGGCSCGCSCSGCGMKDSYHKT